jgi:hypothetical protein
MFLFFPQSDSGGYLSRTEENNSTIYPPTRNSLTRRLFKTYLKKLKQKSRLKKEHSDFSCRGFQS